MNPKGTGASSQFARYIRVGSPRCLARSDLMRPELRSAPRSLSCLMDSICRHRRSAVISHLHVVYEEPCVSRIALFVCNDVGPSMRALEQGGCECLARWLQNGLAHPFFQRLSVPAWERSTVCCTDPNGCIGVGQTLIPQIERGGRRRERRGWSAPDRGQAEGNVKLQLSDTRKLASYTGIYTWEPLVMVDEWTSGHPPPLVVHPHGGGSPLCRKSSGILLLSTQLLH